MPLGSTEKKKKEKQKIIFAYIDCEFRKFGVDTNGSFGFQWMDSEGKTPLIVACMNPQLINVAKTLIELGANVNAYRPGNVLWHL